MRLSQPAVWLTQAANTDKDGIRPGTGSMVRKGQKQRQETAPGDRWVPLIAISPCSRAEVGSGGGIV
jgi:hypothetical protein